MPETLTAMEQEILFLYASVESIGSMVNYELLDVSGEGVEAQAIFKNFHSPKNLHYSLGGFSFEVFAGGHRKKSFAIRGLDSNR